MLCLAAKALEALSHMRGFWTIARFAELSTSRHLILTARLAAETGHVLGVEVIAEIIHD